MASESLQAPSNTEGLQHGSTMTEEPTPIELILDHAVTSTDQQLVCTMAMVCRDWRAATQRAAVGRLHVKLEFENGWAPRADSLPSNSLRKLTSFAQWLRKHAQMVSKLMVSNRPQLSAPAGRSSNEWLRCVAEPTLGLALCDVAAATAPHGAVLKALPASSLTELEVLSQISWQDMSGLAAALPRLTKLQRLKAGSWYSRSKSDRGMVTATLQAACQLSALTSLEVGGVFSSDLNFLPPQLLRLALQVQEQDQEVVDLSHLARLTSLDIDAAIAFGGFTVPVQLIELCTRGLKKRSSMSRLYNITSLRQLETFSIINSTENAQELLQLGQLANLQNLALRYERADLAVKASLAWPQLRQLKDVTLDFWPGCPATECIDLGRKLGSLTQLTRLNLNFALFGFPGDALLGFPGEGAPNVAICHEVAKLKMLRNLSFDCHDRHNNQLSCVQSDICHLSRLTDLTKLELCSRCSPDDQDVFADPTVVRLLLQMKQLEELCVPVNGATVLPVIANLTNLKRLWLLGAPERLKASGPQYLQGLTMLTELKWF